MKTQVTSQSLGNEDPADGRAILARTRALITPALREAVAGLQPDMGRVVGYHLGTHDRHGAPANDDGGKAFRPALVLLACQAVRGDPAQALPAAIAVELAHNASLIHDDIIDGDRTRRGRPAVWRMFGVPTAILAGDALFFLAIQVLAESPALAGRGVTVLTAAVQRLIEGEHADVLMAGQDGTALADAQEMAAAKTAALIAASCALGAIAGGATDDQVEGLRGFGRHLGEAFQLMDDLQGIWGNPAVTGKPTSDLAAGKKSLPVAFALAGEGRPSAELAALYASDRTLCLEQLLRVADLVEAAGGRAWALAEAERHIRQAQSLLQDTGYDPDTAARLVALGGLIRTMGRRT
ncbi:polyprenyl synthetase family protein [Streptomyces sp. A3M-1-3]|uniref:polyprenyl synthetase family protein n=1 Tax=Streptomyces sp. A3M-1-3 TaxID=2962044 RepID=UPI0020B8C973|nr:polyprenyl synthetase family protein [Streptomyces sp. A3M-1-3]MCP3819384.1 polyprenyl synthetase family protein [Streptomyces sp. A3M-1-3]